VNPKKKSFDNRTFRRVVWRPVFGRGFWPHLTLGILLLCDFSIQAQPSVAQGSRAFDVGAAQRGLANTTGASETAREQAPEPQMAGTISGMVVDRTGAIVVGARVRLTRENQTLEAVSDGDGRFSFADIAPGPFELTTSSEGFATNRYSGTLQSGENCVVAPIALVVAAASTEVQVALSPTEVAEAEIKDEEKQRILGFVPNFYVTYDPAAAPLRPKQKFELAWKATIDPVNFGLNGVVAGIEQASDDFSGYGQGAQGYAKRYGAGYADLVTSTFIGGAVLPSLFKQDPRYFYKGTGTKKSRVFYAIAMSVICKGDNGHWQANYSAIMGGLAAGGLSNLYYPDTDRNGVAFAFENALIGIGTTAAANLLQEFVIRKLTPHAPSYAPVNPNGR
jgi:carboxypeptidase family protein